jgi:hypothetical protein
MMRLVYPRPENHYFQIIFKKKLTAFPGFCKNTYFPYPKLFLTNVFIVRLSANSTAIGYG